MRDKFGVRPSVDEARNLRRTPVERTGVHRNRYWLDARSKQHVSGDHDTDAGEADLQTPGRYSRAKSAANDHADDARDDKRHAPSNP